MADTDEDGRPLDDDGVAIVDPNVNVTPDIDIVDSVPTALTTPYDTLAGQRAAATTPDFAGYVAPTTTPDVAKGEQFITPETTVAGQLESILAKGSPLQRLAETRAREQASALGMMSSTSGIGASQRALYDAALKVATPDAASATAFARAEQDTLNQQQTIATEAQVSGAMIQQKSEIAEQQKKLDDSFAISLRGLDRETESQMIDKKAEWDEKFKGMEATLAEKLQDQQISADVETSIRNQSTTMINDYQKSIQLLLADDFYQQAPKGDKDLLFNDMFVTTTAAIKFSAEAAGIYTPTFQASLEALIEGNNWVST